MKWLSAIASCGLALALPASALAAGGPVPPAQGGEGIAVPGSAVRYDAFGAGRDTVVKRLSASDGVTESSVRIRGRYGIPGSDFSGSTTGLAADGHTLILGPMSAARASSPRTTRLVVLDTPRLDVRTTVALPGSWTVDAISPHGHWLYLIHYFAADGSRYEVRAYDLRGDHLIAKPVVDPREPDEKMTGFPVTRVVSADGRWAYTLYGRPQGPPFLHALDTVGRRAVCIDLPSVSTGNLGEAQLALASGGELLRIDAGGRVDATVDTRTFSVFPRRGLAEIVAALQKLGATMRPSFI